MDARKLQVKLFIESPPEVDITPIVPVFHDWIRKNALGELLIDVTEYGHVHHGPSLLLVGNESDYAIDFDEGRPGLFYSRKRGASSGAKAAVVDAVRRALFAAKKLESETLPEPIRFRGDELVLRINDRLAAPNTKETMAAIEPVLRDALKAVYAGAGLTIEQLGERRELFAVRVKAPGAPGIGELLGRIS